MSFHLRRRCFHWCLPSNDSFVLRRIIVALSLWIKNVVHPLPDSPRVCSQLTALLSENTTGHSKAHFALSLPSPFSKSFLPCFFLFPNYSSEFLVLCLRASAFSRARSALLRSPTSEGAVSCEHTLELGESWNVWPDSRFTSWALELAVEAGSRNASSLSKCRWKHLHLKRKGIKLFPQRDTRKFTLSFIKLFPQWDTQKSTLPVLSLLLLPK